MEIQNDEEEVPRVHQRRSVQDRRAGGWLGMSMGLWLQIGAILFSVGAATLGQYMSFHDRMGKVEDRVENNRQAVEIRLANDERVMAESKLDTKEQLSRINDKLDQLLGYRVSPEFRGYSK